MKRIGIVVLSRHITSLGGIGFYVDSFVNCFSGMYVCDLIVDRPIKKDDIPFKNLKSCKIVCHPESLAYGISSKYSMFQSDKSHPEMSVNIIRSIMHGHKTSVYDALFVNSFELIPGLLHSGLQKLIPSFAFTHDNWFYEDFPNSLDLYGHLNAPAIEIPHLCQVPNWTWDCIKGDQCFMPMPSSEYDLIKEIQPKPEANTVLFNGTYRDIKRPKDFFEFCKLYKKKALIITNDSGKKYFTEAMSAAGLDFEIRTHIFGREKIEFISRAEMMFQPSKAEMFSYAVLEALAYCPVVVYHEKWSDRYPEGLLNYIDSIKSFDSSKIGTSKRDWVLNYMNPKNIQDRFDSYLSGFAKINLDPSRSPSKPKLQELKTEGISIEEYNSKILGRDSLCFADLVTTYKFKSEFPVVQTEDGSYFWKDNRSESLDSFFE